MDAPRLVMTVDEAAASLGISRRLAYQMARSGSLPTRRLGRRILVPVKALEAWLVESADEATA